MVIGRNGIELDAVVHRQAQVLTDVFVPGIAVAGGEVALSERGVIGRSLAVGDEESAAVEAGAIGAAAVAKFRADVNEAAADGKAVLELRDRGRAIAQRLVGGFEGSAVLAV